MTEAPIRGTRQQDCKPHQTQRSRGTGKIASQVRPLACSPAVLSDVQGSTLDGKNQGKPQENKATDCRHRFILPTTQKAKQQGQEKVAAVKRPSTIGNIGHAPHCVLTSLRLTGIGLMHDVVNSHYSQLMGCLQPSRGSRLHFPPLNAFRLPSRWPKK
jgi:hypothetical protein